MTGNEYQYNAMTLGAKEECKNIFNAALGLGGEAGEVQDIIKKHEFQGHDLVLDDVKNELGDVLWYVALMCETLGISLDEVMEMNLTKIKKRYPNGFNYESSVNRSE